MTDNPQEPTATVHAGGREIAVSHPGRIYFPKDNYTKRDVLEHYARVGEAMAGVTSSRALALRRYPRGIAEKGFFQKRVSSYFPDWVPRASLPISDGVLEYAVGGDAAGLVWLASIGTIEFHAMLSRIDKPHAPDQIIFDIDPPVDYCDEVRLAALGLKAILDDLGLTSFVKSTGSRGFHVIVPVLRRYDFDHTRAFAKRVAARLMEEQPGALTLELRKASRGERILVDVWRNGYGQTAIAPYSLRARHGAPVAVPLGWDELASPDIHPRAVTLANFASHVGAIMAAWPARLGPARPIGAAWKALKD